MKQETPMATWKVTVNDHACEGKETCLDVCPTDVFQMRPTTVRNPFFPFKIKVRGGIQAAYRQCQLMKQHVSVVWNA
jgi:Fe-S-cluster-containing hydrogenase component 2